MERYSEYKDSGVQWLGEIPGHWERTKVSRVFRTIGSGTTPTSGDDSLYSITGIPWLQSGDFNNSEINSTSKNITEKALRNHSLKLYNPGGIVIAMYGASIGKVGLLNIACTVNQACCVLSDSTLLLQKYAFYFFIHNKDVFIKKSRGGTQPNISQEIIKSQYIPLPPLPEQKAIAAYLDTKCGKIDQLLEGKQKQIGLLAEIKQRIIADAVTRGLNPSAKMKTTDIPWLPEVPAHWEEVRNKSLLKLTEEKVGSRTDITLLSLTKNGVIVRDLSEGKGKFPKDFGTYLVVRPYNLVFCLFDLDETPRTVGLVRNTGMLTGAYTNFEVNENIVLPEYIYYFYLQVDNIKGLRPYYTGLRKVVKTNTFLQIRIPVPPISEQREIVAYLDKKIAKIDTLTAKLQQEIATIKEYKQRLISDVVTGQKKVCG